MITEQWNKDPEFKALPYERKTRILSNYFNDEMADDEFRALPEDRQNKIRSNFLSSEGFAPKTVGLGSRILGAFKDYGEDLAEAGVEDDAYFEGQEVEPMGLSGHPKGYGFSGEWDEHEFAPVEALGALADTAGRIPENLAAKVIMAAQGQSGASVADRGVADRFVNWVEDRNRKLSERYEESGDLIPGVISNRDVADLGPNLAFSGTSMAGTVGGGLAGGVLGPPGVVAGGVAGGGATAYRMDSYQVMNDWLKKVNQESIEKGLGPISKEEEKKFKDEMSSLATEHGLWEAGPEGLGNVLELALLTAKNIPGVRWLPKGMLGKAAKGAMRLGGTFLTEEATETTTQMGQHNVEVEAGTSGEPVREWTSGDDILKSAKEVLPQVLMLSGVMTAGGAAYRKAKGVTAAEDPPPTTEQPQFTQEDIDSKAQQLKTTLDSGQATPAQLREAIKALPEGDIRIPAINQVLEAESPTARPIDLTGPKPTGADFLARERNQEEIDRISRREETVEQLKQNLDAKLQAEELAAEEAEWERTAGDIRGQQLAQKIGLGRKKLGETRPTTLQQQIVPETVITEQEDVLRETAPGTNVWRVVEKKGKKGGMVRAVTMYGTEDSETPGQKFTLKISYSPDGNLRNVKLYENEGTKIEDFIYSHKIGDFKSADGTIRKFNVGDSIDEVVSRVATAEGRDIDGNVVHHVEYAPTPPPAPEKTDVALEDAGATIDVEANRAATSPTNDLPEPTIAQQEAGNYKKGHIMVQGMDIAIENPEGSERKGVSPDGKEWSTLMKDHYGYFKRTEGKDGDQIDTFVGSDIESPSVFIVDQVDPKTGKFDEHKVMTGFPTMEAARDGYLSNYEEGWQGLGNITEMPIDEFKGWLAKGKQKKPVALTDRRTKQLKSLRIKEKRISQRRVDEIGRKKINEMTEEEKGIALKYHELTGLQSKRAYNESEKKPIQVSIDVDALKWVNDTFGHDEAGNDLLITVGKALTQTDIDSYHISGDEFYLQSDSTENIDKAIEKAYAYLENNPLDLEYPDGTKTTYKAGFSYGKGKDLKRAETELQKHKTERKLSERGAKPARGLGERTERDETGLERKDTGREVKPKKGFRHKKTPPEAAESIKPETLPTTSETKKAAETIPQAQPTAEGKAPWEMTKSEYLALRKKAFKPIFKGAMGRYNMNNASVDMERHQSEIKQAIKEGKPVPAEALKDYPDLKKKETPTDMFGQPVPTDMFGGAIPETKKPKRKGFRKKEKRVPTQAQKPLFGEDKTQIQPELELGKKKAQYSTKTIFKDSNISLKDVQSLFKGQRVGIAPDGTIFVKTRLGRGVKIKSVETIANDEMAFEVAYSREKLSDEDEKISGRYFDGVITISKVGDKWTLAHESEHFLEDANFINKNDQKALSGEIKRRARKGTWKTLNPDDIGGSEDRAEFIAQELKKRSDSRPTVQRVIQKIQDLIDAFVNLYKRTAKGVTRDIESGKIYGKKGIPEIKQKALREGMPMFSVKKPDLDPDIQELLNKLMPEAEAKKFKKPTGLPRSSKKPNIIEEKFGRTEKTPKETVIEAVEGVKTKEFWDKVATKTLDRLHPIKTFLSDKAYKLHRIETGTQAVLSMFLEHGKLKWDSSGFLTMDERKQGFLPFLKSLGKDWDKFIYWTAAKRAENLSKQGRERWLDKEAREEIFNWTGGKNNPKWVKASKEFKEFNSNILDIAEKAGLIDPEGRKIWEQEFYVPFYRIFEDFTTRDEFLKAPRKNKRFISAQIQRLKGANAKMGDPLENLMHNWTHLINESLRNVSRAEAFDFAVKNDLDIIEEVGVKDINSFRSSKDKKTVYVTKNTQENVLMFQRGGKPVYFKVSEPELFHAMSNVNAKHLDNFVIQLMGKAKRALTFGATFGPGFRVANLLRDTMHTAMINKSFKPFYDSAIGFKKSWMEDAEYISLMASGAGFGSSYVRADDPKTLNKYIKRIIKKEGDGALKLILNTPKKMLDFWEKVGSASENAARVQLYSNLLSDGKTHTEAAFEARDLLDFTMRGESGTVQLLIQTIPFLNARMQGLYKLGRAVADKENTKNFAIRGAILTAASLSLWALYRDDDRWKELEDWDKWSYYHFWIGDKHFRIPKPFEVGAIFSSFPETMADVLYGNDETKHIADFIGYTARENFAIGVPQLFSPIMEQWANKSSFTGRPIVGQHLKGLKPSEQKDPWTSETIQLIAGKMNISPKRAEALINSYFSTFGMFLLSGSDIITRNAFDFPERPAMRIDDYPLVGRFIKESRPARHTKHTTWFYETLKDIDESVKTLNHFERTGDIEKAKGLLKTDKDKLKWRKAFVEYRGALSQINRRMKRILLNKKYGADQKREEIDKLVTLRNGMIKHLYEAYGKRQN